MSFSIRSNIASLDTERNLNNTQNELNSSLQKLSSGYRINKAADDAAGLAISDKMLAQVQGLNQAQLNGQSGIDMLQTGEGAMNEQTTMLQRMRVLAVEAANGTMTSSDRANLAQEVGQLQQQFDNIAQSTSYNGQSLINGSLSTALGAVTPAIMQGASTAAGNVSAIDVSGALAGHTFLFSAASPAGTITLTDTTNGNSQTINNATVIASYNSTSGSETLAFSSLGVKITLSATAASASANLDAVFHAADSIATSTTGGTVTLQVGANTSAGNTVALSFIDTSLNATSSNTTMAALYTAINNFVNVGTNQSNATALINAIDPSLQTIDANRATLGAQQNRVQASIDNMAVSSENLQSAYSDIKDVNVAQESAALSQNTVLMQAGVSVLAQANQLPQLALKLLG